MHPFEYARPASLAEAVALLAERGPEARVLAGGTDLVIRLRDGSLAPQPRGGRQAGPGAGARDPGRRRRDAS